MTTSADPWTDLATPANADLINARRVDEELPWGLFWAKGIDRKCMLILQHAVGSTPSGKLPKLRGIDVTLSEPDRGIRMLSLKLAEAQYRDIFEKLCRDIVAAAANARTEVEATGIFLARTWRWHHLLRGGGDQRLSVEQQKGLIGELLTLESMLFPATGVANAVAAWVGPTGAPKDFELGRICIEVKARRGAATPYVTVSSEDQLDTAGTDALFLHVVELDVAPDDVPDCFTVTDVARRLQTEIGKAEPGSAEKFDGLLAASGFSWDDDYADFLWIEGAHRLFEVRDGFPRITRSDFPPGVSRVRYEIALPECEPFRAEDEMFAYLVRG